MKTLNIKLKQHTPLIHFQHDQYGATLRASEVKPKLDKFILSKLGNGDYNEGVKKAQKNKWLVGKGEHPALNYKMRIDVDGKFDISMPESVVMDRRRNVPKCNEYGKRLYTTPNYPDNNNSLIMGNMGGKVKEEVLNFTMYKDIVISFRFISKVFDKKIVDLSELMELIESNCVQFFGENNFGNRTSKGFGSFTVNMINGEPIKKSIERDWELEYVLLPKNDDRIKNKSVYKDIFTVINQMWKYFKRNSRERIVEKRVFLGVQNSLTGREDRIPSPLMFKPIIKMNKDKVKVEMLMFLKSDVIESANADIGDFYELIDNLLEEYTIKDYNLIHDIEVIN